LEEQLGMGDFKLTTWNVEWLVSVVVSERAENAA
jgi:hypothetical protein